MADTVTLPGSGQVVATDEFAIGGVQQHVQLMRPYGGALLAGTVSVGTSATVLAASTEVSEVMVQADPSNAADVFIGHSSVQSMRMESGVYLALGVYNLNQVYARAATGT